MSFEFFQPLLVATVGVFALMTLVWWIALRIDNLGIVDIAWSYAFAPVAIYYALVTDGDVLRRWIMAGLVCGWSLRLGTHLCIRVMGHHPREDVRYAEMRKRWQNRFKLQVFLFFQAQAVLIVLLSVPFLLCCWNDAPGISSWEISGIIVWIISFSGETLADWQLKQFKRESKDSHAVCRRGLWNYSRHPNYFFEWLVWVSFFLFALGSPGGCLTIYCPALMLFFLLRVTGIPLTESLAVARKGDAYRDYQRTTSPFVPWFKRT